MISRSTLANQSATGKDLPKAEVHVLDAGHFALDTATDEIAELMQAFVTSSRGELQARRAG